MSEIDPGLRAEHEAASEAYHRACWEYEDALANRDDLSVRVEAGAALEAAGQRLHRALSAVVEARRTGSDRPLPLPTFTDLLRDPTQQLDREGAVLRSVLEYQSAKPGTASATPPDGTPQ